MTLTTKTRATLYFYRCKWCGVVFPSRSPPPGTAHLCDPANDQTRVGQVEFIGHRGFEEDEFV